jgi:hypothetical protein
VRIAGEAIKVCNDKFGTIGPAGLDRLGQFGTIIHLLAALDLDEILDQRPAAVIEIVGDGLALSPQDPAGFALPLRRHSQVADPFPSAMAPSQIIIQVVKADAREIEAGSGRRTGRTHGGWPGGRLGPTLTGGSASPRWPCKSAPLAESRARCFRKGWIDIRVGTKINWEAWTRRSAKREVVLAWIDECGSRRRIDQGLGQLKVRDLENALAHETVRLCLLTGIQIMSRQFVKLQGVSPLAPLMHQQGS